MSGSRRARPPVGSAHPATTPGSTASRSSTGPSFRPTTPAPRRVVFVQADCAPSQALDEARWVAGLEMVRARGDRGRGGSALARPRGPSRCARRRSAWSWASGTCCRASRSRPSTIPRFAVVSWLSALAALTFDACVRHPQLGALEACCARFPDLRVVLDHLGKPPVDEGIASEAGAALVRRDPLARRSARTARQALGAARRVSGCRGLRRERGRLHPASASRRSAPSARCSAATGR